MPDQTTSTLPKPDVSATLKALGLPGNTSSKRQYASRKKKRHLFIGKKLFRLFTIIGSLASLVAILVPNMEGDASEAPLLPSEYIGGPIAPLRVRDIRTESKKSARYLVSIAEILQSRPIDHLDINIALAYTESILSAESDPTTTAALYTVDGALRMSKEDYQGAIDNFTKANSLSSGSYWANCLAAWHAYPQEIDRRIEERADLESLQQLVTEKKEFQQRCRAAKEP